MTTLLNHLPTRTESTTTPAQRLRATMAAARVSFTWMGTRKTLTPQQRTQAAETFDAEGGFFSAAKKLLDTKHPAFRALTAVRGKIETYWRTLSLPYPEPGVRLIRQKDVEWFTAHMADYKVELEDAVANLDRHYSELRSVAAQRLGSLYNPADYPETLLGLFAVTWDFPNVEPPDYLTQLNPEIYEQECARVSARFEEAVQLAEQAFMDEFSKLVAHLCERLTGSEEGQPKVFRDTAVGNLVDFFERFRMLNVRSSDQLDDLVAQAQRIVGGVDAQALRDRPAVRDNVAARLSQVQAGLDELLVDRPRRRILREEGPMDLVVDPKGTVRCVYGEGIDLGALGALQMARASHVDPDASGRWTADLRPVGGPVLGPFLRRSEALAAEATWLCSNWLPAAH